jgi:hypothetical protein
MAGVVMPFAFLPILTLRRTSVGVLKMMAMTTAHMATERTSATLYIFSVPAQKLENSS